MYYYKTLVASNKYHGEEALTYSSNEPLNVGAVIQVPLRNAKSSAIVVEKVAKPGFRVKPILQLQVAKPLPASCLELLTWLVDYYPAPISFSASLLLPSNLLARKTLEAPTLPPGTKQTESLPPLTSEQQQAVHRINDAKPSPVLIHGNTGSGKTRVYIELAQECLQNGKSVIVLTPEIGLTSQLADSFRRSVAAPVLIMHSNLTGQERRQLWLQCLYADQPMVIIGPRSALFAPISNVGLIVLDEAHDSSYKQDQLPRYNALRVAGKLASLHGAQLIFGTATPLVSEYYIFQAKGLPIVRMTKAAAGDEPKRHVQVIDLKDRSLFTKNPHFSDYFLEHIARNLDNREQSLVFLNRRGTARVVLCQNCGWQAMCPRCNVPLTYHGDSHSLRCHTCGYQQQSPTTCPDCHSLDILYRSMGTKALVDVLQARFPEARIQRFDTDNTKQEKLEHHYLNVKSGNIDILVGTQMLVKGLDLPLLSLVGVVAADSSLQFPDFTAEEQTFQLLSQVMGRVGRGHRPGTVVIQTHNTGGAALQAVLNTNYEEFYQQQIAERQQFIYPPFCYLLKITCSRKSSASAAAACQKVKDLISELHLKVDVIGPTPSFKEQSSGQFHWQLVVKARQRSMLLDIIKQLPASTTYDIDPTNLL